MRNFSIVFFGGLLVVIIGLSIVSIVKSNKTSSNSNNGVGVVIATTTEKYNALEEEGEIGVIPQSGTTTITAKAYLVKDLTTDSVVVEKDSDRTLPIASLTKLITAVLVRHLIDPNTRITIGAKVMQIYGNTAGFTEGETFTASDLMYPLLMVSSNDSAEALASVYGRIKFIKAMNDFAQSIGAYRTYIADPAGLSPDNVSSPSDIVRIINWIYSNDPTILEITKLKTKTIRDHVWTNPTYFLNWSSYLGGKNGYLPEANRTGVGLFSIGVSSASVNSTTSLSVATSSKLSSRGDIYAVVVLGSSLRDQDVTTLLGKIK